MYRPMITAEIGDHIAAALNEIPLEVRRIALEAFRSEFAEHYWIFDTHGRVCFELNETWR